MQNPPLSRCLAVDFESYYDSEVSLTTMSTYEYLHDPKFDAYLVSFVNDEIEWVGDPKKADWDLCHDRWLVMHNASFDSAVFERLQELGVIPASVRPKGFLCTADMAAYLRCKRALAAAARILLGVTVSKAVRSDMKGKTYQDAVAAGMEQELLQYGKDDSVLCWDLYKKCRDLWPLHEQETSRIMREGAAYGIQVDVASMEEGIARLGQIRDEALARMPWAASHDDKPMSAARIRKQGREDGIPVPASLAVTSPDAIAWIKKYGETVPWVKAVGEYRSVNALYKKMLNLRAGVDKAGIFHFNVRYFGAQTGRSSGGSSYDSGAKVNMLNLPRVDMFGVNMRGLFVARPGHILMAPDLAQIEARFLLWAVGDTELIDLVRKEGNLYQGYAKKQGWYTGSDIKKDDRPLYDRTKATVLSLGYGSGWRKFQSMAATRYGVEFTDEEAQRVVSEYRRDNPKVTAFWADQHAWLRLSARHNDDTHEVALPSGRDLIYYEPRFVRGGDIQAYPVRGVNPRKLYGGLITENFCQAGTRDILCDARIAIAADDKDNRVLLDVYDELLIEIPLDGAEQRAEHIAKLMVSSSPWAEGCPIECEYALVDSYMKG